MSRLYLQGFFTISFTIFSSFLIRKNHSFTSLRVVVRGVPTFTPTSTPSSQGFLSNRWRRRWWRYHKEILSGVHTTSDSKRSIHDHKNTFLETKNQRGNNSLIGVMTKRKMNNDDSEDMLEIESSSNNISSSTTGRRRRSPRLLSKNVIKDDSKNNNNDNDDQQNKSKKKSKPTVIGTENNNNGTKRKRKRTPKEVTKDEASTKEENKSLEKEIQSSSPSSSKKQNNNNSNEALPSSSDPLIDLGILVKGILVKRPSAKVRSPYVADVRILSSNEKTTDDATSKTNNNDDVEVEEELIVQAHSPALDVGGLCSVGATVYMSKRPPGGKTSHSIELLEAPGPKSNNCNDVKDDDDVVLVGCHPSLGEKLAEEVLKRGLLQDSLGFGVADLVQAESKGSSKTKKKKNSTKKKKKNDEDEEGEDVEENEEKDVSAIIENTTKLYKQRTYGDSRIDFELVEAPTTESNSSDQTITRNLRALIEVKNVVCSDYSAKHAPVKTGPNHCVIIAPETIQQKGNSKKDYAEQEYQRSGIFPWGRVGQTFEGKKVVSERAIKHLRNLATLNNVEGGIDVEKGSCQTVVLFVLNRSDCVRMRACHEACYVFANELKAVHDKGTKVLCFRTRWTKDGKAYFDGMVPVTV